MDKIYIIEDDEALRTELADLLRLQGYAVDVCMDFSTAASDAIASNADCILLDLKLPGTSGHAICRAIREESQVPLIMITSSESEFDEVMGMNLGADDYVTKPYSPAVLLARIQSILRRANASDESTVLEHKGVRLDTRSALVSFDGHTDELTRNELRMLSLLMANPGCIITRQEMMCSLWESDEFIDDNTLTVNVNRLRKKLTKLGVDPAFLTTRRGQGYSV